MAEKKMSQQRKQLIEELSSLLSDGNLEWRAQWGRQEIPISGLTGKRYRGCNRMLLTLVQEKRGYKDPRWLTYRQMVDHGWAFKKGENGEPLGRGAGIPVEFIELEDRKTKKVFDRTKIEMLSEEEQKEYMKKNVFPFGKTFYVFNGDLVEGLPKRTERLVTSGDGNPRAEQFLAFWDTKECPILFDAKESYYIPSKDEIHLPQRNSFYSPEDLYSTVFHEIGHATGHPTRLNRNLNASFGDPAYAKEELRAELTSLFLEQDFGIQVSPEHLQNNAAYLQAWLKPLQNNPQDFLEAIGDADRMTTYILDKERTHVPLQYAAEMVMDSELATYYRPLITDKRGGIMPLGRKQFSTKEAMRQAVYKYAKEEGRDGTLEEVSKEHLLEVAGRTIPQVQFHTGGRYEIPSKYLEEERKKQVTKQLPAPDFERLSDRDLYDKAAHAPFGEHFVELFNGAQLFKTKEENEQSLLFRLAIYGSQDEERIMRVFRKSKQYDATREPVYGTLLKQAVHYVEELQKGSGEELAPTTGRHGIKHRDGNERM